MAFSEEELDTLCNHITVNAAISANFFVDGDTWSPPDIRFDSDQPVWWVIFSVEQSPDYSPTRRTYERFPVRIAVSLWMLESTRPGYIEVDMREVERSRMTCAFMQGARPRLCVYDLGDDLGSINVGVEIIPGLMLGCNVPIDQGQNRIVVHSGANDRRQLRMNPATHVDVLRTFFNASFHLSDHMVTTNLAHWLRDLTIGENRPQGDSGHHSLFVRLPFPRSVHEADWRLRVDRVKNVEPKPFTGKHVRRKINL